MRRNMYVAGMFPLVQREQGVVWAEAVTQLVQCGPGFDFPPIAPSLHPSRRFRFLCQLEC